MMQKNDLTQGPVGIKLFSLSVPMVFGIFALMAFNLVDTVFISKLGTKELAAISFTFPVVFLVGSVAMGLGVALSSVVSKAFGQKDIIKVRKLTTHGLILSLLVVMAVAAAGLITMRQVFAFLGAGDDIFPFIKRYMAVWYIGSVFLVVPMVGNNAIRASGDTKVPAIIMAVSAGINIVLDPFLIFGWGIFPRLELFGAAVATVAARAVSFAIAVFVLAYQKKMLDFSLPVINEMLRSWKRILYIGIPTSITNLFLPLSIGVITRLAARFGLAAVAAVGAAIRVEAFAVMAVLALSAALVPFIGQNWGAGKFGRVCQAQQFSNKFSLWWGLGCVAVFFVIAGPVARLFSSSQEVVSHIVRYLWIVPFGYGLRGVRLLTAATFNALNKPINAAAINAIWMFGLHIPLSYIGSHLLSLNGLFGGVCLAHIFSGAVSFFWIQRTCRFAVPARSL